MNFREDCAYRKDCIKRVVIEGYLNLANRSQGCLPNCRNCNTFTKNEMNEEKKG